MSASALVGEIEGVRRTTRRASFGAAVPLALLGLLVCGAAPFYAMAYGTTVMGSGGELFVKEHAWTTRVLPVQSNLGARDFALSVYWLVAVPVVFLAIAAYYAWRARGTGLSIDGWRVAAAGVGVYVALLGVMSALRMVDGARPHGVGPAAFLNPLLVVAIGVFALARVERSRTVLAVAVVFALGVFGADVKVYAAYATESPWDTVRGWGTGTLLLGAWLLLAAAAAWLISTRKKARS